MRRAPLIVVLALCAPAAGAAGSPQWPPPNADAGRIRELQEVIISRDSTPGQREAAREELGSYLKSPAGQQRGRTVDEKPVRVPRAAITDPIHVEVVPVTPASPVPPSGVARLEVVEPPKPIVIPRSGSIAAPTTPSGNFAIDPRTGNVLHGTGAGYVDPRTGQFTPR
jgi:hypothetical protein